MKQSLVVAVLCGMLVGMWIKDSTAAAPVTDCRIVDIGPMFRFSGLPVRIIADDRK